MSKTTNSYRTSDQNKKALSDAWGSVSAGTEKAVDAYVALRPRVLNSLKGHFTRAELSLLVDIQNGTIFDPRLCANTSVLVAGIEDSIQYDGVDQKWGVDKDTLVSKVLRLQDGTNVYFLLEEINRFWNEPAAWGNQTPDLDGFLDKYAEK